MKILVTGAAGYMGRHIVDALLDRGVDVIAFDLVTDSVDPRATRIDGDFTLFSDDVFVKMGCPDVCLHLAWKDGFKHDSSEHVLNLASHFRFLENMMNGGLKQLAVMGTMHEIGYFEGEVDEDTPTNPSSLYGIAKNALRESVTILCKRKNVILQWLRAYYIYGDDLKNHSVFAKIAIAESENKPFFPFTSGKNMYDFISIDELSDQISSTVLQTQVTGVINCCSGHPVPLKDMVEKYIQDNGFKIKLEYGVFPDRAYDSPAIWGNNEKINKIISTKE